MTIFILVFLTALFGVAGDIFINQWAKTSLLKWIVFSIPMWTLAAILFGVVLRQKHYSFAVAVVVVVLVHSGIVLAWDHFVEKAVLTPIQWVGVATAIGAIILMEVGAKH